MIHLDILLILAYEGGVVIVSSASSNHHCVSVRLHACRVNACNCLAGTTTH